MAPNILHNMKSDRKSFKIPKVLLQVHQTQIQITTIIIITEDDLKYFSLF